MFQEALDFALTFVGIHLEDEGCTLAALGEFLDHDVFPFCGWAGNRTLRDSVVRLLVNESSSKEVTFALRSFQPSHPLTSSAAKQAKLSSENRASGVPLKTQECVHVGQDYNSSPSPNTGSETILQKSITTSDLIRILNEESNLWDDPSPGATSRRVLICPSHELREKVLGVPFHTVTQRQAMDYVSENALNGCDKILSKTKISGKYKQHHLNKGMSRLCRNQVLLAYYLLNSTTYELTCRYFPWYAAPLTELEKKELSATSAEPFLSKEGRLSENNRTPQQLAYQRSIKGNQPINHYFWRLRQANLQLPDYVFDLKAIKHVVRSSPERKLLYQDAIHTIFMVHGLHPHRLNEFNKANRLRLRRMLIAAGLCTVVVAVSVRNRKREVPIVIPEEDFCKFAMSNMSPVKKTKTEEEETLPSIAGETKIEKTEDEERDAMEPVAETLNATGSGSLQMQHSDSANDIKGEESDSSSHSLDTSDSDDENAPSPKTGNTHSEKGFPEMNAARNRFEVAISPLYISADWPHNLQFAKEAERRPIGLVAAFPRMVLYPREKLRCKTLGCFMTNYLKYGTLETYYTLTTRNKSFTLVYAPKAKPLSSVGGGAGSDAVPSQSTPLPAGTSQYSIDIVLNALQTSPHKALTIRQLADIIDNNALHRRVLPYLRSTNRVTTTGVTLKNRERMGIVVLSGTVLTEEEKHAVVELSRESTRHTVVQGKDVLRAAAQPKGRRLKLDVLLLNIPATLDGMDKSEVHEHLSNPNPRVVVMARKIMTIRNGYARSALYRAGRLHLELWKQWHEGIHQGGCGSDEDEKTYAMNAQDIYDNMTLSTFCIVIGFAAVDLTAVLDEHRGHSPHSTSGGVSWATSLRLLPPSVREMCQEQGVQPLLHGLSVLQSHGLIRSNEVLDCFVTKKLQDITIVLECCATDSVRRHTYVLYDPARYTPSMSMCAILRYWLPVWARSVKHAVILHMAELYEAEPNPTVETLVALNRRLRFNVCILAESFYQSCGLNRSLPYDAFSQSSRKDAKTRLALGLLQGGDSVRRSRTRHVIVFRRDTSGITLAKDLGNILTSPLLHKRLRNMLHFLKRLSRAHLSGLPTGLPSLHDPFLTSLQHHAFTLNPYANHGVIHLCALGDALERVLRRFVTHDASATGVGPSSLAKSFQKAVGFVFSPDATSLAVEPSPELPCAPIPSASDQLKLLRATTPPPPELTEASDYEEVLLDSLRMILLSDAAHYRSDVARELVLAFPASLVTRGRNYLQKEPSFNQGCWKRSHRIPELTLAARPLLFTPHLTRPAPRPCANTALLHSWVTRLHGMITKTAGGTTRPELQPHLLTTPSDVEVLIASQPVMEVKEEGVWGAREDDAMATLRVPMLVWPAAARQLERAAHPSHRPYGNDPSQLHEGHQPRRKRLREAYDEGEGPLLDDDFDSRYGEDEEAPTPAVAAMPSMANEADNTASASLYPARTLVRCNEKDIALADRIPTDPEPTLEEAAAVKTNIAQIAAAKNDPQSVLVLFAGRHSSDAAYPLAYPSIFHHVDGAFHNFVWKLFLLSLYRYVLHVPGVLYSTLRKRAMASGLISRRAVDAALHYLVDGGVFVRRRVLTTVGGAEDCYTATTLPEGLWDVTNLN